MYVYGAVLCVPIQAQYTVGGHSFSAAAIEYVILKMQPPVHRPQTVRRLVSFSENNDIHKYIACLWRLILIELYNFLTLNEIFRL